MQRIIKTFLLADKNNLSSSSQEESFGLLLTSPELYVKQELDILARMKEDKRLSGRFSAKNILEEQFPNLFYGWDDVEPFVDDNSFRIYILRFLDERRRIKTSQALLQLSEEVKDKGLRYEDLEELRKYAVNDEEEEEKNILEFDFSKDMNDEVKRERGYRTFIREIDTNIKAFDSGSMISIFAFTSQYKTTLAQNICFKNAIEGKNSVYISLEVPKRMIFWKMVFAYAQSDKFKFHPTYWEMFTNFEWMHKNKPEVYNYLFDVIIPSFNTMAGKIIVYDETDFPEYTEAAFRRKIEEADDALGKKLHGIFWDQASLLKFSTSNRADSYSGETINRFISFIRRMGNAFRKNDDGSWRYLTNIVLAQANRQSFLNVAKDTENVGRYSLTGIAEANEIERASSYVMSVFTNDEMRKNNEATVQLLKCRNGRIIEEPIKVFCNGKSGLFGESVLDIRSRQKIAPKDIDVIADVVGTSGSDESGWDSIFGNSENDDIFPKNGV